MKFYFSKSAKGFYLEGDTMPDDAKELGQDIHNWLITGSHQGGGVIDWSGDTPVLVDPLPITGQALIKSIEGAIQSFMDSKASERGYDNIHSAALRASIPNSPFRAEGVAYAEWMDACWVKCYVLLNKAKIGEVTITQASDVISQLPALSLPDTIF